MNQPIPIDQFVQSFGLFDRSTPPSATRTAPSYGPGVREPQETLQIRNPRASEGTTTQTGAFYGFHTDTTGGAGDGDIYLQGGTINGEAVDTSDLKLYDFGTDSWEGTADQHLYVGVTGAFVVVDSVALPGFTVSSVATPAIGTPPSDTFPAVTGATSASSGTCYVSLGVFTASGFLPAASGNRIVGLCITPPYSVSVS